MNPEMNCERISELLPDYLEGSLGRGQGGPVEQHLRQCASCMETVALWNKLSLLPQEQPSEMLRARFFATLAAYQEAQAEAAPRFVERRRAQIVPFWSAGWQRWAVAAAAAVVLVVASFTMGRVTARGSAQDDPQARIAKLEQDLASTQQLMMLSLMQQQSPSRRLEGISMTAQQGQIDPKVMDALLYALRYDTNVDVRLASLNALAAHSRQPQVKDGLVQALHPQQSPLVQLELINMLVELRNRDAVRQLHSIRQDSQVNPAVRQRAEWALTRLSSTN